MSDCLNKDHLVLEFWFAQLSSSFQARIVPLFILQILMIPKETFYLMVDMGK